MIVSLAAIHTYGAAVSLSTPVGSLGPPGAHPFCIARRVEGRGLDFEGILSCLYCSVSHAHEVGSEFLDRVCRCAGLYCLGIMCDEKCLFRLYDDHAFSSLLSIQTRVVGFDDNVFLTGDMQSRGLDSLGCRAIFVRAHNFLHLRRCHVKACRAGPYRVAFCVEDGGFIDVAGAHKALVDICLPRHGC